MHLSGRVGVAAAAIIVAVAGYVVLVLVSAGPHALSEATREKSPLSFLSSLLLGGAGALAIGRALSSRRPVSFAVLAGALFLLACDERFMGHERLKAKLLSTIFDRDRSKMGMLGDLPLPLFLAGITALLARLRDELTPSPTRRLLLAAVVLGAVSAVLDVATVRREVQLFEELLELASETLFFLALLLLSPSDRAPLQPNEAVLIQKAGHDSPHAPDARSEEPVGPL